jgi:hypothetical protein
MAFVPASDDKIIVLNANSQLHIKLDGDNFPAWRIQFLALLTGYNLIGYIDGTTTCPAKIIGEDPTNINPEFTTWTRQDQLIIHAIVSSVTATVVTHFATVKIAKQAWDTLSTMYANRSRVQVMALKHKISTKKRLVPFQCYLTQVALSHFNKKTHFLWR